MTANPFIALIEDPVAVITALGIAVALLSFVALTLTAISLFLDRGWRHLVWLGNAWDFKHTDQRFGPEWETSFPPREVTSHAWRLGVYVTLICAVVAIDLFAIGAVVYVLTP